MDREAGGRGDNAEDAGDYQRVQDKFPEHVQNAACARTAVEHSLSRGDGEKLE
ncbi:hypothetical protein SDC9_196173 [bioreactor metagenome]|uniref:Uncharacterized protein n=1 Tax=bioreactor metagenome TaxID=1076179 RepID=A0A645IMU5_9ZZZZ